MISNIIVNVLDSSITELNKGVNLFAEGGILGKCVIVKCEPIPFSHIAPSVRKAFTKFYIKGYDIADAIELGEKIISVLDDTKGVYTHNDVNYNIKAVDILATPTVTNVEDKVVMLHADVFYVRNSN